MSKVFVALGSQEKFAKLGDFSLTSKDGKMNLYYNIDLGDHRFSMYDVDSRVYKNLNELHRSFHYSGLGHTKETSESDKLLAGQVSDA